MPQTIGITNRLGENEAPARLVTPAGVIRLVKQCWNCYPHALQLFAFQTLLIYHTLANLSRQNEAPARLTTPAGVIRLVILWNYDYYLTLRH